MSISGVLSPYSIAHIGGANNGDVLTPAVRLAQHHALFAGLLLGHDANQECDRWTVLAG
jgi:hypothetical protein